MATAYVADNYYVPMPSIAAVGVVLRRDFLFTCPNLVINDTIKLCKIPAGGAPLIITNYFIDLTDLDGAASLAISLGDEDAPARFMAIQSAVGQAAGKIVGTASGTAATGIMGGDLAILPIQYSAAKNFILKVTTAPGTPATGTIKGYMDYHYVGAVSPIQAPV